MKDLFKVNTRTIVATGLGAAIFTLLFMYVKVPSPVPETSFQTAYGLSAFFATLFGPIAGALISFIGHALSDCHSIRLPLVELGNRQRRIRLHFWFCLQAHPGRRG
jgi:hypothetical protein